MKLNNPLNHCLSIESLGGQIPSILATAQDFIDTNGGFKHSNTLNNTILANLFFEPSTRTRCSFELAARYLGANVINLDTQASAHQKGETLFDTVNNLAAMGVELFAIRHPDSGIPEIIANQVTDNIHIINAGDGCHAHPTQALGDMLTLQQHQPDFSKLKIAIIGDIAHSRVARSQIQALSALGAGEIRLIAPNAFMPTDLDQLPVTAHNDLASGLNGANVIITLRIQKERIKESNAISFEAFAHEYGINEANLARCNPADDFIILHPGPINRGIELSSTLADHPKHSRILKQVRNGIAARMAVLSMPTSN